MFFFDSTAFICNFDMSYYSYCNWKDKKLALNELSRLKQQLEIWDENPDNLWKILVMHHPPFMQSDNNEFDIQILIDHLLPVIESSSLDLILTGHEHL